MWAITLHQPWASLILAGVKRHETRSWLPGESKIGQRVAIHAAKRAVHPTELSPALKNICFSTFGGGWEHRLPRGALICTAVLTWARSTELVLAMGDSGECDVADADIIAGDWGAGRVAWRLDDVERLAMPVPLPGRQGWFWA